MSVERRGESWRVRYRDEQGRNRSRTVARKRDAEALDAELRRRKRLGELAQHEAGKQTLGAFAEEWFEQYAVPRLAPQTREGYARAWDKHIAPSLGGLPLSSLTHEHGDRLVAELTAKGLSSYTVRSYFTILHSVLQRAVEWDRLSRNPVSSVALPAGVRSRSVLPFTPIEVERLRRQLDERDAVLVSTLAYAGLRPGEARALRWEDVTERALVVSAESSKTGVARAVSLLAPLAEDLAGWKEATPNPEYVFPGPGRGRRYTGVWTQFGYREWTQRVWRPAVRGTPHSGSRPYDLRHSFVSLLIQERRNILEIARQAGHDPTLTLKTYGHVFDAMIDMPPMPAEDLIRSAREEIHEHSRAD